MSAALPLRDVHLPPEPALWPLAPGWWLVMGGVLVIIGIPLVIAALRARRRRRWRLEFDAQLAGAGDAAARLGVMVGLLRRAARQRQPGSELLQGQAWLQFVDPSHALLPEQRDLLLEGSYRPVVDGAELTRLQVWAAGRFVSLREGRRP